MFHLYFSIQGEYIAPDKIENIYIKSPYVAQAFVHGHSLKVRKISLPFSFVLNAIATLLILRAPVMAHL